MKIIHFPIKRQKLFTCVLLCLAGTVLSASAQTLGYVQDEVIKVSGATTDLQTFSLSVSQKQTTKIYYDGLGRTLQTIAVKGSPLQNDLIQPQAYDNAGRQTKAFMPYAGKSSDVMGSYRSTAVSTDQPAFYTNTSQYLVAYDSAPYSQQQFDNSPLQRVLRATQPGVDFSLSVHFRQFNYRTNTSTDGNILIWNPDGTFSGTYYPANALDVKEGIDEDGKTVVSFTDNDGHLLLKRQVLSAGSYLDTYYVYNDTGTIAFVIPPQALAAMGTYGYNVGNSVVNNLIFAFTYNTRGLLITKKVPGKTLVSIIYDPLNRPVLVQEAHQQASYKWSYLKYDALGRAVSTGIYTDMTNIGQVNMQNYVKSLPGYATTWFESRTSTLTNSGYYTNSVFPTTSISALTYSYYDDYDIDMNGAADYGYVSQGLSGEASQTAAPVKDAPTVVSTRSVGSGFGSNIWLQKYIFYDRNGHVIQIRSNNQLTATLNDYATTVPNFTGVPQITKVSKTTGGAMVTVQSTFSYDHMDRLTAVSQAYNGGSAVTVAAYSYNELGQVVKKSLGAVSGGYLQNVDMRYDVGGRLVKINNSKLSNDGGVTNGDNNDLFGLELFYQKAETNLGNSQYYNGNLSGVKWMSKDGSGTSSDERGFRFAYDVVNRYSGETYVDRSSGATSAFTVTHGWDETITGYDVGGNIMGLTRNSATTMAGSGSMIDNLTYTYNSTNPGQLQSVSDATGNSGGFVYGSGNYSYDGYSGNLTSDPYKGITSITYNDINQSDVMTLTGSRSITYTYSAGGTLLRKIVTFPGSTTTTDYIDGFVYTNSTLAYFAIPEGRVRNVSGTLKKEFIISDQQGNARISFEDNGSGVAVVRQENSYYGFGMPLTNSPVPTLTDANKRLYNGGSEWQNDFNNMPDYYKTFYRNYDAALGRFVAVDPLAENAESLTVYEYAGNNPIMGNDPQGDVYRLTKADETSGDVDGGGKGGACGFCTTGIGRGDTPDFYPNTTGSFAKFIASLVNTSPDNTKFSGDQIMELFEHYQSTRNVTIGDIVRASPAPSFGDPNVAVDANQGGYDVRFIIPTSPSAINLKRIGESYYTNVTYEEVFYDARNIFNLRTLHVEISSLNIMFSARDKYTGHYIGMTEAQTELASIFTYARFDVLNGWLDHRINTVDEANEVLIQRLNGVMNGWFRYGNAAERTPTPWIGPAKSSLVYLFP